MIEHFNKITNVPRDLPSRGYDPGIGRFTGVDPIADDFPWVTTYNYAENEPIAHIDLWGLQGRNVNNEDENKYISEFATEFMNRVEEEGFWSATINTFGLNFNIAGDPEENKEAISNMNKSKDALDEQSEKVDNKLENLQERARGVGLYADNVQLSALGITVGTWGGSAPVTGPIAAGAEAVSTGALITELGIDYIRDNRIDKPKSEIVTDFIFRGSGRAIKSGVKALNIGGKNAKRTQDAIKSRGELINSAAKRAVEEKSENNSQKTC